MVMNLSTMLFTMSLIMGTIISISSNSWIGGWMGLELNLMAFIPMMSKNKTPYESESAMKYFLVQAMASIMVLFSILASNIQPFEATSLMEQTMMLALMMKMGAAPLHFWFPAVMQGMAWDNCFILMTWQKIAPMVLFSYVMYMSMYTAAVIITCVLVGSVGGLNQTSIRKLMAYSSISHLGWMISALMMSNSYWSMYFILYTILNMSIVLIMWKFNLYQVNQIFNQKSNKMSIKFAMFLSMMSLGGLPPFLGFLPKWVIIQNMINSGQFYTTIIMVMTTLITLFFYLRIMFSSITLMSSSLNWKSSPPQESLLLIVMGTSLMGIPMIMMLPML